MMPTERPPTFSPGQLADAFEDLVAGRRADYRDDLVGRVRATPQRPAWTFIERWNPVTLITARPATATPLRGAWVLLLTGLVVAALVASLVIVGSALLRDERPDGLNAGLLVPTLELDRTWDASSIEGLSQPSGLDMGPDGNLYVVNAGKDEIVVISPDGDVVRRWGERGAGDGQFYFQRDSQDPTSTIGGIAVAPDGAVYVADTVNDRVQRFDSAGTFISSWGGFGPDDGQFLNPFDVAIGADGTVLVADLVRDDIQRFDPDGHHLQTIGEHGTADGQLNDTGGVAVDPDGGIYNADFGNDRLQAFRQDGTFSWSIGRGPGDAVTLTEPGDVVVDDDEFIYVTEKDRLTVLTPEREVASTWDLPAGGVDEEWMPIAVASDETVYVSAGYNDVIYKLRNTRREAVTIAASTPAAEAPASSSPAVIPLVTTEPAGVAGTFEVGAPFAVPFTAYRPAGWVPGSTTTGSTSMDLMRPGSAMYTQAVVQVFVPTNAYADPCLSMEPMSPPVGPTVDDLTTVLTTLPGILVTRPVADITIDGYSGKTFDLESTLIAVECPAGAQWAPMWTFDKNGDEAFAGPGDNFHQRIAILDVDGTRVLIEIWTFDDTTPSVVADAIRIFDSIDFS